MSDNWSERLMDKLAGELSEKEALRFEEEISQDERMTEEYQFFTSVWEEIGEFKVSAPKDTLSKKFYTKLEQAIQKEENSFENIIKQRIGYLLSNFGWVKNLSFGLLLLAVGFILGGKLNKKTINVNQTTVHTSDTQNSSVTYQPYVPATQKIQSIKTIPQSYTNDEGFQKLKAVLQTERNTNLKIAALRQIEEHYSDAKGLKSFLANQLQREQSPLVQVEMVNLMLNNHQSRETIRTMESMLRKKQLNPMVEEKLRQDLPVLKASFVK